MKILVLGSINIDYNYYVGHITTPKETQGSFYVIYDGILDWIGWTGNVGQAQGAAVH